MEPPSQHLVPLIGLLCTLLLFQPQNWSYSIFQQKQIICVCHNCIV